MSYFGEKEALEFEGRLIKASSNAEREYILKDTIHSCLDTHAITVEDHRSGLANINSKYKEIINRLPSIEQTMKDNNNPIVNHGSMTINNGNTNISNNTQNIGNTFSQENKNDIKKIIQFLKENVEHLNLSNDDVTDIKNEVQVLESQINRESPKKERINSALEFIQSMLTSIAANLYTPKVEAIVNKIGGLIGNVPIG